MIFFCVEFRTPQVYFPVLRYSLAGVRSLTSVLLTFLVLGNSVAADPPTACPLEIGDVIAYTFNNMTPGSRTACIDWKIADRVNCIACDPPKISCVILKIIQNTNSDRALVTWVEPLKYLHLNYFIRS